MCTRAIRIIAAKGSKPHRGYIQLLCHVKPGVSARRAVIAAVSDEAIVLCVAAQAKEGEANKAVRQVISEVFNIPKSDVDIAKGLKSREKTVVITNVVDKDLPPGDEVERIRIILKKSVSR